MKQLVIVMGFVAFGSSASAEGLKAMWRARQAGSQVGNLEQAIKTHERHVELNGGWSSRDVSRLRSSSRALARTLQGMREGGQPLRPEITARLEALQMPSFRASVGVSTNLFGRRGFDPSDVSTMERLSSMTDSYSALFKIADSMGVRMKSMKLTLAIPREANITRRGNQPGVDVEITR